MRFVMARAVAPITGVRVPRDAATDAAQDGDCQ